MSVPTKEKIIGYYKGRFKDLCKIYQSPDYTPQLPCPNQSFPACKFWGAFRAIIAMRNVIPIIHSPIGCAWGAKILGSEANKNLNVCVTTNIDEADVIFGGENKLKKTILDVDKIYKPELIAVFTSCAAGIIGDDSKGIIDEVEEMINAAIFLVETPGFGCRNHMWGLEDAVQRLIMKFMEPKEMIPRSFNLMGEWYPDVLINPNTDGSALIRLLEKCGLRFVSSITGGSGLADVKNAPAAAVNAARCESTVLNSCELMQKKFGTPYVVDIIPIGIESTRSWCKQVVTLAEVGDKAERIIDDEAKKAEEEIGKIAPKLKGKKVALTVGPSKAIAEAKFLAELGMEVVYLGIHYTRELTWPLLKKAIDSTGMDPVIHFEQSIDKDEIEALKDMHIDLFLGEEQEKPHVYSATGVFPLGSHIYAQPWYAFEGAVRFVETIGSLLNHPLAKTLARFRPKRPLEGLHDYHFCFEEE